MKEFNEKALASIVENLHCVNEAAVFLQGEPAKDIQEFMQKLSRASQLCNEALENIKRDCPELYEKICKS